jgi:molecular chaperone GrpE
MSNEKKTEHAPETEQGQPSEDPFARSEAEPKAEKTAGADSCAPQDEAADADMQEAESPDERIRDLEERLKRAVAEQENVRKRMEREKEDIAKYAMANFAREVLGIADNIHRAINAVPRDAAEKDAALKTFLEGIEVTERELQKAMERHGIVRLNPEGEKFDPNFHQAMFEIPTPNQPSGVVMQVMQPGYTLGDRLLRPAMVGVSKAAPAASGANENNPQGGGAQNRPETDAGKPQEQAGEGRAQGATAHENAETSTARQASTGKTEPESAEPASGQARGSSRLNEPVINADTEKAFGTGDAARRKS